MEVDDLPQIDPNVDYNLIQPIHQKRTIAFVNHFLFSTVSFLNNFADACESRLMQFEYKLQKIEASLLILESQLSSIPDLNDAKPKIDIDLPEVPTNDVNRDAIDHASNDLQNQNGEDNSANNTERTNGEESSQSINGYEKEVNHEQIEQSGPKASSDPRFAKFFKMLQFGVPPEAVRLKMKVEGIDPNILDTPNAIIPGYDNN